MPALMGRDAKKKELITHLSRVYETISHTHHISMGDFPNLSRMQECLALQDFKTFSSLQNRLIKAVDDMLANDVGRLMQMIPQVRDLNAKSPDYSFFRQTYHVVFCFFRAWCLITFLRKAILHWI